jgi:hypothetical protein
VRKEEKKEGKKDGPAEGRKEGRKTKEGANVPEVNNFQRGNAVPVPGLFCISGREGKEERWRRKERKKVVKKGRW